MASRRIRKNKIEFYVDDEELELIELKMREINLTNRSDYMRRMALQGYIIKQDFSYIDDLVYELNKVGTNINQIAKKINESNIVSNEDIKIVKELMEMVWEKVADKL